MHLALGNLAFLEGLQHQLFGIEDVGRTGKSEPLLARDLCHRTFGRQVAFEYLQMAGRFQRIGNRPHNLLPGAQSRQILHILPQGLAGDGHAVAVQQSLLQKHLGNRRQAADSLEIFHNVRAAGLEIGK